MSLQLTNSDVSEGDQTISALHQVIKTKMSYKKKAAEILNMQRVLNRQLEQVKVQAIIAKKLKKN